MIPGGIGTTIARGAIIAGRRSIATTVAGLAAAGGLRRR